MIRALLLLALASIPARAMTVEVVSFGWDGCTRRGRPTPLVVRVTSDAAFRGDLEISGGPIRHAFPLDLPAKSARELRMNFTFYAAPEVTWKAGAEGGTLETGAKEVQPGETLVAADKEAVGRKPERYKADFPPASRFFLVEFPRDATPDLFAAIDGVILKDRGADRAAFAATLPGEAAFRSRGGAILWADGVSRAWDGRIDTRDDVTLGEDTYAVFDRPAWIAGPRPYLPRLFGFALAPVALAALAAALLPLGRRARWGSAIGILVAGAALARAAAPPTMTASESFAIEIARGNAWDRLAVTALTVPVGSRPVFVFAPGAAPEPVFFSARDANERQITLRWSDSGCEIRPGELAARATVAVARRDTRPMAGSLRAEGLNAVNESDRDLRDAFIVDNGKAAWIGDLLAGSSRTASGEEKMSAIRSRLGATPRRRLLELWWRRADHDRAWLVGFADGEPGRDGNPVTAVHHGVLIVVPIR